jgi:hypothetical protein
MKKKMLYDRTICPELTDAKTRCKECVFWHKTGFKHLDFIMVGNCPWDFSKIVKKGEKLDKDTILLIKMAGCEVMLEICPNCLIIDNMRRCATHKPRLVMVDDNWHITDRPEVQKLIPNPDNPLMLWCPNCEKTFHHNDVAHAVNPMKIMRKQYPELQKIIQISSIEKGTPIEDKKGEEK